MAVTYTSTMQPASHRELLIFVDSFGASSRLYIHANQAANRAALIAAHVATAEANEASMTLLLAAASPVAAAAPPTATPETTSSGNNSTTVPVSGGTK